MVSTPYLRGRAWEYKALRILREDGWVCSRSAMSHGPVDIFAANGRRVVLIQVKSGSSRLGGAEREDLAQWAKAFRAEAEIWRFRKRGKLEKIPVFPAKRGHAE